MKILLYSLIILLIPGCGTQIIMSGSLPFLVAKPFNFNLQILDNDPKLNPSLNQYSASNSCVLKKDAIPNVPLRTMQ